MKSDLDALMQKRGLDAIFVTGGEGYSVERDYLSNGADITGGYIVKKLGEDPILIVSGMETEEAKKSGYPVKSWNELGLYDLYNEYEDADLRSIVFWGICLETAGVSSGKIGFYGNGALHVFVKLFNMANEHFEQYEFIGETGLTLFDEAYLTKDELEIERIKSVAERTNAVMEAAWNYIASHSADENEELVNADGEKLTIGEVKRFVRAALVERGLEDTGMIFAQGRDAGFPHSRGEAHDVLKLGQSIVFDLFPRELGGGYHHDMTRTWCIGYAPPEVQEIYDTVMEAFDISVETFKLNQGTHLMQEAVLDYFEGKGHPTGRSDTKTDKGYVHGLGHSIGLNVHESLRISHLTKNDTWQVGNVVTIEPGLYYPDKGLGVRIEDLFIITEKGELISLTPFKKDLVLPINGQ